MIREWTNGSTMGAFLPSATPGLGAGEVILSTPCSLQLSDFDGGTLESDK